MIDHVRIILNQQMGQQEGFFQNTQDDLVRTVIQVLLPLWPDADFLEFADLITNPYHFRAICQMVYQESAQVVKPKQEEVIDPEWLSDRPYISARYRELDDRMRQVVLTASKTFLMDTMTNQNSNWLKRSQKD